MAKETWPSCMGEAPKFAVEENGRTAHRIHGEGDIGSNLHVNFTSAVVRESSGNVWPHNWRGAATSGRNINVTGQEEGVYFCLDCVGNFPGT